MNNGITEDRIEWNNSYKDQGKLRLTKQEFNQILNNQAIVERLAKLFRKMYVGTDCQTTFKLHDVSMLIRECFAFEGDNLETGEMILNLTLHSNGSGDKS